MPRDAAVYRPPGALAPAEPAFSEDGVDLTLIRWMLSLTPSERLRELTSFVQAAERHWERSNPCPDAPTSKPS